MTHRSYASAPFLAILLAFLLPVAVVWAQDDAEPQPPAKEAPAASETAEPAVQPPAAETETPAASEDVPASARAEFDAIFAEFKEVLKELRQLQTNYHETEIADEATRRQVEQQFAEQIAKGNQLLPDLQRAGIKAYQAAPNEDRELTRFLVKMLKDNVQRDQYEMALEIGEALIANDCLSDEIYAPTGVANFALHNFEAAAEQLEKAQSAGATSGDAMGLIAVAKEYQELWKKEQELRAAEAEANDLPRVKLTTSKGEIVVELFENEAPGAVGNFISLVESGFYDGLTFHRVLPGFMAQTGCPNGDGSGGPGYMIYDECRKPEARMHFRGSLSMAKTARPNTGGSQFFLTFQPTPHLNNQHTVFGRVIEGMDVLAKLQRINPDAEDEQPEPDKIIEAKVERKRDHEYLPNKVE